MENQGSLTQITADTRELFDLFHFIQTMDRDDFSERIADIGYPQERGLSTSGDMCFYRVKKLAYDADYPRREAFQNVLDALDNEAFNFVYVLSGNSQGVTLHIGVVKNHRKNTKTLSTVNYGGIIENAFEGNFSGSALERLDVDALQETMINQAKVYKSAGIISGIPSINRKETGEELDFQGVDRLINSMSGQNWRIVVVCEPVSQPELAQMRDDIYELYNRLSVYAKTSVQRSVNSGDSISFGRTVSDSHGKNRSWNESDTESRGRASSSGTSNSGTSRQLGRGGGTSQDHSEGKNWGYSQNRGTSEAVTVEMANKHAQDLMQYIDDELLPRVKEGYGKGMFRTSLFYMADKVTTADRLKLSVMSLFQGDRSTFAPLTARELNLGDRISLQALQSYQNAYYDRKEYSLDAATLLGRPVDAMFGLGMSAYLTAGEAGILAGLPQKEVPGIVLDESVPFGLNQHAIEKQDAIDVGVIVQKGRKLNIRFALKKDSMMKHTFVAGVTGSGKTTTCHKLLAAADAPFLVIEPAKTEYRTLAQEKNKAKFGEVYVFTLGNESVAPFRLNPFELVPGEVISAHIDMLKATFTSAFPMEASMPQILEEAIVQCYEDKGWDLDTNENKKYKHPFTDSLDKSFPTMSELLTQMKKIVKQKGFSQQMQADYEGSLVSRLSNLTVGGKGRMLNCPYSTNFQFVAHNRVILEMEELKSPEDKALFMGFILSRLSAVIRAEHKRDAAYRHLTLIEEAHRLLAKPEYGDSGSKKAAVETFTDLLAEVRKYGEGLIIVDQIPNKLAPEVLKNTNTKIIHKILARDDKEAVGDTMLMDEKQKEFLSALPPGHVIVFSEETDKPVHVCVERETDTNEDEIGEEVIKEQFEGNCTMYGRIYENLYMDREVEKNYDLYVTVTNQIATRKLEQEKLDDLKAVIHSISENLVCPLDGKEPKKQGMNAGDAKRKVIEKFYTTRERKTGNAPEDDRIQRAVDFLSGLLGKENVTYQDLGRDQCRLFAYIEKKK